jgi:hypothetical protein
MTDVDKVIATYVKILDDQLLEDRMEYSIDDLTAGYPDLSKKEIARLYTLIQSDDGISVFDYFKQKLAIAPDDATLRDLWLGSPCGLDCKGIIDATSQWIHYATMARGIDDVTRDKMIACCEETVETFWRG